MTRWTKHELSAHLSEIHPHGQNITPREELLRWSLEELRNAHRALHGIEFRHDLSEHGPEEAYGHD